MCQLEIRQKPARQGNLHSNHDTEPKLQVSNLFLGEIEFRYGFSNSITVRTDFFSVPSSISASASGRRVSDDMDHATQNRTG
uniref:Uncharacterized protein n=1 Tax=Candidatus Kentrum sp. FM TaxID=2126340 RepID=A0A450SN34_9GAMM|nr:MAG: hypothetical protein BECKFM1743C_GA0114222_101538 [Candidatus Kentron sp. FM]VFJ55754.1 MAG: hypothetical protein BECKFM1743A_GA0114220_101551 [Candidatus Kentron sp. FM]VFK10959.1 MAG: hypothetical protein BECKFM1743B_GA0114221_101621 [Candidatus Kentron sp. FM]